MDKDDYSERCFYDPIKNIWIIPEDWIEESDDDWQVDPDGIGDLEDAMG